LFWQSLWLDDYHSPVPENSDSEKDVRVSIVEDDAGVRESLADLIGHVPGLICVGAHPDGGIRARARRREAYKTLIHLDQSFVRSSKSPGSG
jgi:hypothetical protein